MNECTLYHINFFVYPAIRSGTRADTWSTLCSIDKIRRNLLVIPDGTDHVLVIHTTVGVLSLNKTICLWDRSTAWSSTSKWSSAATFSRSLLNIVPFGFCVVMNSDLMEIGHWILHTIEVSDDNIPNNNLPTLLADASQCPSYLGC